MTTTTLKPVLCVCVRVCRWLRDQEANHNRRTKLNTNKFTEMRVCVCERERDTTAVTKDNHRFRRKRNPFYILFYRDKITYI